MKHSCLIFLSAFVLLACARIAPAQQSPQIATASPSQGLKVVIIWPASANVTGFNLYRKQATDPSFPATPINAVPLAVYKSRDAIESVIPEGSMVWNSLITVLTTGNTPFDPGSISTIAPGSSAMARLQLLAQTQWQIAVVIGQGYLDTAVAAGTIYQYELHGVNTLGTDTGSLYPPVSIQAGVPVAVPAPSGVTATAGDSRVLVLWTSQPQAAGYIVYRATAQPGPYQQVNPGTAVGQFTKHLDGTPLPSPSLGFLDLMHWTPEGEPTTHSVNGVNIDGPVDGTTYYYKISSTDLLGQAGPPPSTPLSATPLDTTPPMTPVGVVATAIDTLKKIEVRWTVSPLDSEGHVDSSGVSSYRVYRFDSENAPLNTGVQVGGTIPVPPAGTTTASASDNSSVLTPQYGEKTFWYRVQAVDAAGNVSSPSAAVGAHLKDVTPPASPTGVAAEGFDDYIKVTWSANTEPDLDGYDIYRSLCHNGVCNPCDPAVLITSPVAGTQGEGKTICGGAYSLIGTVAAKPARPISPVFEDHTIPSGSPLCYSYWVRAFDKSQNKSGGQPPNNPDVPAATDNTVCQRLRDKTPPDAAIITGLLARQDSVNIQWIGAPVQDIAAYHVYRSDQENNGYVWIGGMTVPITAPPQVLTSPYKAPATVGCSTIPLTLTDAMSMGSFTDKKAEAKKIYWYKVVGIDQNGNETPLEKAVPMSTFSYSMALPPAPTITSVKGTAGSPVGLAISWSPAFDAAKMQGFAVFRSDQQNGFYRQIGTLLQANQYVDTLIVKGVKYWYKLVQMDASGQVSPASVAVSGTL